MAVFDPNQLRTIRKHKKITAAELAKRIGTSPAQIHRLETGQRRLTVDTLLSYCEALQINPANLFTPNTWVPITGVIDSNFEIQPLPPSSPGKTLAPPLISDMHTLAALRWAASRRFQPMLDHTVFYRRDIIGVPDFAWNKRCLVMRQDGSQVLGWPVRNDKQVHINLGDGPVEFNVDIKWASPVIAVMPPFAIDALEAPGV